MCQESRKDQIICWRVAGLSSRFPIHGSSFAVVFVLELIHAEPTGGRHFLGCPLNRGPSIDIRRGDLLDAFGGRIIVGDAFHSKTEKENMPANPEKGQRPDPLSES
jgi:hypothetical protein